MRTKGKHAYGMTSRKAAALAAIGQDEKITHACHVSALCQFTETFIKHASDLARSGQKDSARDWYRYFEAAQIVEIVRGADANRAASLGAKISQLGLECHPDEVANWATDIEEIRDSLREILTVLNAGNEAGLIHTRNRVESAPSSLPSPQRSFQFIQTYEQ